MRNRVRELRYCKPADLRPHPRNWRTHPAQQSSALKEILAEVGIAGALLAYDSKRAGGLTLIDGHLRRDSADTAWPVLVLDVDDAEADLLLATFDPLSAMAQSAAEKLDALLKDVRPAGEALTEMLAGVRTGSGVFEAEEVAPPVLADGDRAPFQQMTFTLHDSQAESVKAALAKAKAAGAGDGAENENSNGNALAFICEAFNGRG